MIDDHQSDGLDRVDREEKEDLAEPPRYQVVFINDDYTPMHFVVELLIGRFRHDASTAVDLMLTVHETGSAIAGIYSRDVAETLAELTTADARTAGHPLQVTCAPVS